MLMLDLFCGLGGASAAMRARGWTVVGVDSEPRLQPDVVADLATWRYQGPRPDLIWASPPCTEFSKHSKSCWYPDAPSPSMELAVRTLNLIREIEPRFWLVENVAGARKFFAPLLGPPLDRSGSVWVWGQMPALFRLPLPTYGHKDNVSRKASGDPRLEALNSRQRQAQKRAVIPYAVSLAVAEAIERVS